MKKPILMMMVAGMFAFASCESASEERAEETADQVEDSAEEQADQIEEAGEEQADQIEDGADTTEVIQ